MKWATVTGSSSVLTASAVGAIPWYVTVVLGVLGTVVYICRLIVIRDLGRLAIGKTAAQYVPEVMSSITGVDCAHRARHLDPQEAQRD